jgi:hypothetical protein
VIVVARFSVFRQFLLLKRHVSQVIWRGGHRCFLRQSAHASSLLAVIFARHQNTIDTDGAGPERGARLAVAAGW